MNPIRRRHVGFLWLLLAVVGANYLAQIPYYLHLYYLPHGLLPSASGVALLGFTCVWFLAGYIGLARGCVAGYWLLLAFLLVEVSFYLRGILIRVTNGYPAFQNMLTHDPILRVVFGIGYLNMVAGACFIVYMARHRRTLTTPAPPAPLTRPRQG